MSLDDTLVRALRRHLHPRAELVSAEPLAGGANASILRVVVDVCGETRALVLRRAVSDDGFAMVVDKRTEALVQKLASEHDVPVAKVAFVLEPDDALGAGYAMDFVAGETRPAKYLASEPTRRALATHVGAVLASIHRVPVDRLPPLEGGSVRDRVLALRAHYDAFDEPSPVFELAFRSLLERIPRPRATALVHGDFRTGNLLVGDEGVRAVLDWELCHLGDPIEDLGWCCVAAWRFGRLADRVGGFGSVAELRRGYVAAGGEDFDDDELDFWEVYGTLRWGVICLYQVFAHLRGEIPSIERAAIGRRQSEVELDLLRLLP